MTRNAGNTPYERQRCRFLSNMICGTKRGGGERTTQAWWRRIWYASYEWVVVVRPIGFSSRETLRASCCSMFTSAAFPSSLVRFSKRR
jgi:hypothetical protein